MKRKSGSQNRKLTARIAVNCTPEQKAKIAERAERAGQSPSAICLHALLDQPLPLRRNPTVKERAMTQYLGHTAMVSDRLRDQLAELGKSGSNLNQIAHMVNADTAPMRIVNIIESAIQEHQSLVAIYKELAGDLKELRTMGMNALGLEL
jgi:hypothetical protein